METMTFEEYDEMMSKRVAQVVNTTSPEAEFLGYETDEFGEVMAVFTGVIL